jgi:hypothetical protein
MAFFKHLCGALGHFMLLLFATEYLIGNIWLREPWYQHRGTIEFIPASEAQPPMSYKELETHDTHN